MTRCHDSCLRNCQFFLKTIFNIEKLSKQHRLMQTSLTLSPSLIIRVWVYVEESSIKCEIRFVSYLSTQLLIYWFFLSTIHSSSFAVVSESRVESSERCQIDSNFYSKRSAKEVVAMRQFSLPYRITHSEHLKQKLEVSECKINTQFINFLQLFLFTFFIQLIFSS